MRWLLILQISIYFNFFFSLPWIWIHIRALSGRVCFGNCYFEPVVTNSRFSPQTGLTPTGRFLSMTGYCTIFVLEFPRLVVGYTGNLFQRPALLMSFWLMTILIHFPIQSYLLVSANSLLLRPIEVVMDTIMLIFLFIQSASGIMAVRRTIVKVMSRSRKAENESQSNDFAQ